ncbi:CxxxxCH/CxxCH domain-containing protein [Rhizobium sp.]
MCHRDGQPAADAYRDRGLPSWTSGLDD